MIASKTGGLTNLSKLNSTTFNLVNTVACLLKSYYYKDEYVSDDIVSNIYSRLLYGKVFLLSIAVLQFKF